MSELHTFTLLPAESDCLLVMVFDKTEKSGFAMDLHTLHASLGADTTISRHEQIPASPAMVGLKVKNEIKSRAQRHTFVSLIITSSHFSISTL